MLLLVIIHFHFVIPLFFSFRHDFATTFVRAISLETDTLRDSKLSVLLGPAVLFCTIAYHPIRFVSCFFFCHDFVRAISLELLLAETPN